MLEQLNLYDVLGKEEDPLYQSLKSLNEEEEIKIDSFTIQKSKLYEVKNDEIHIGFKDVDCCYDFLKPYFF